MAVHVSKDPKRNDRGKPNLVNETNSFRVMKLTLIVIVSRYFYVLLIFCCTNC